MKTASKNYLKNQTNTNALKLKKGRMETTQTTAFHRVPWETLAVREKRALVKTASKNYRKNPTNTNARKLEKACVCKNRILKV